MNDKSALDSLIKALVSAGFSEESRSESTASIKHPQAGSMTLTLSGDVLSCRVQDSDVPLMWSISGRRMSSVACDVVTDCLSMSGKPPCDLIGLPKPPLLSSDHDDNNAFDFFEPCSDYGEACARGRRWISLARSKVFAFTPLVTVGSAMSAVLGNHDGYDLGSSRSKIVKGLLDAKWHGVTPEKTFSSELVWSPKSYPRLRFFIPFSAASILDIELPGKDGSHPKWRSVWLEGAPAKGSEGSMVDSISSIISATESVDFSDDAIDRSWTKKSWALSLRHRAMFTRIVWDSLAGNQAALGGFVTSLPNGGMSITVEFAGHGQGHSSPGVGSLRSSRFELAEGSDGCLQFFPVAIHTATGSQTLDIDQMDFSLSFHPLFPSMGWCVRCAREGIRYSA